MAARTILRDGGVVFGVAMDDKGIAETVYIEDEAHIYRLQSSKYVQAYVGDTYIQAKKFLDEGREVLFSGTPCQIAGLYGYLGKAYDQLYTVDIVCLALLTAYQVECYMTIGYYLLPIYLVLCDINGITDDPGMRREAR